MGRQSRRPLQQAFALSCRGGRLCPPAGYAYFMGIFGEFVTSQRADVGSAPTGLRRIRTAPQILNAERFYRSYLNATAHEFGVP